jgi:hypothetical protein
MQSPKGLNSHFAYAFAEKPGNARISGFCQPRTYQSPAAFQAHTMQTTRVVQDFFNKL